VKCIAALAVAAASLCLSACGGSTSSPAHSSRHLTVPGSRSRPSAIYRVRLSGRIEVPRGAPQGRGDAVIALHGSSLLCWRFAHLHGFSDATVAHVHAGPAGRAGPIVVVLSAGPRLHHQGCVTISPTVGQAIVSNPTAYYVNIHSGRYPAGAVRAQL
jgi:hypothetical protein